MHFTLRHFQRRGAEDGPQEIAAEHAQQVEEATIEGLARQVERSQKERAVGDSKMEPSQEREAAELRLQASRVETELAEAAEAQPEIDQDYDPANRETEAKPEPDHEAIGQGKQPPPQHSEALGQVQSVANGDA